MEFTVYPLIWYENKFTGITDANERLTFNYRTRADLWKNNCVPFGWMIIRINDNQAEFLGPVDRSDQPSLKIAAYIDDKVWINGNSTEIHSPEELVEFVENQQVDRLIIRLSTEIPKSLKYINWVRFSDKLTLEEMLSEYPENRIRQRCNLMYHFPFEHYPYNLRYTLQRIGYPSMKLHDTVYEKLYQSGHHYNVYCYDIFQIYLDKMMASGDDREQQMAELLQHDILEQYRYAFLAAIPLLDSTMQAIRQRLDELNPIWIYEFKLYVTGSIEVTGVKQLDYYDYVLKFKQDKINDDLGGYLGDLIRSNPTYTKHWSCCNGEVKFKAVTSPVILKDLTKEIILRFSQKNYTLPEIPTSFELADLIVTRRKNQELVEMVRIKDNMLPVKLYDPTKHTLDLKYYHKEIKNLYKSLGPYL